MVYNPLKKLIINLTSVRSLFHLFMLFLFWFIVLNFNILNALIFLECIDDECLFLGVVIVMDEIWHGKTGTMIVNKYRLSNFDILIYCVLIYYYFIHCLMSEYKQRFMIHFSSILQFKSVRVSIRNCDHNH